MVPYWRVDLSRSGSQRTRPVHRLVAEAFIGPCPEGQEVCHGPGGGFDNRLANLSYGTHSRNCLDKTRDGTTLRSEQGSSARLTWDQVDEIRRRAVDVPRALLAREYGVHVDTIRDILTGRSWKGCRPVQAQRALALAPFEVRAFRV